MRVLLVSDLHYDLRRLDWVVARVADPASAIEVVVVAGDLLDVGSAVPLDTQIAVVLGYLERLAERVPTLVCSGNHDLDHRTPSGEKATRWLASARRHGVHVDGDSFDRDGWRLTSCAWWEGPETLAALEARLDAAAVDRPGRWLWAFHGPPEGPLSWTGSRHYEGPLRVGDLPDDGGHRGGDRGAAGLAQQRADLADERVAPVDRTVRAIPTELALGLVDGMPTECAASFDNLRVVPKALLVERICALPSTRLVEACRALRVAVDC